MDERSSWMRLLITVAIDWRFVIALVLPRPGATGQVAKPPGGPTPSGNENSIAQSLSCE